MTSVSPRRGRNKENCTSTSVASLQSEDKRKPHLIIRKRRGKILPFQGVALELRLPLEAEYMCNGSATEKKNHKKQKINLSADAGR